MTSSTDTHYFLESLNEKKKLKKRSDLDLGSDSETGNKFLNKKNPDKESIRILGSSGVRFKTP